MIIYKILAVLLVDIRSNRLPGPTFENFSEFPIRMKNKTGPSRALRLKLKKR